MISFHKPKFDHNDMAPSFRDTSYSQYTIFILCFCGSNGLVKH